MLTRAIASEELIGDVRPDDELLEMDGMDEQLAFQLAASGVRSMEDLAELSVDELTEKGKIEDEERAAALIMIARQPWFEGEADKNNEVAIDG